jgi:hypothetical protein
MTSTEYPRTSVGETVYAGTEYSSDCDCESDQALVSPTAHRALVPEAILKIVEEYTSDPLPHQNRMAAFLNRPPALGLSEEDIAGLRAFDVAEGTLLRDRVRIFRALRSRLLRQFVVCDGASTITELAEALDAERAAGKPSPLPAWLRFKSPDDRPPHTQGLRRCCARNCFRVETGALKMKKCGKCPARYCSAPCQTKDWKDRHRHMCAAAKKTSEGTTRPAGGGDELMDRVVDAGFGDWMMRFRENGGDVLAAMPPHFRALIDELGGMDPSMAGMMTMFARNPNVSAMLASTSPEMSALFAANPSPEGQAAALEQIAFDRFLEQFSPGSSSSPPMGGARGGGRGGARGGGRDGGGRSTERTREVD